MSEQLTTEQRFTIESVRRDFPNRTRAELEDMVLILLHERFAQKNHYAELIKKKWGL